MTSLHPAATWWLPAISQSFTHKKIITLESTKILGVVCQETKSKTTYIFHNITSPVLSACIAIVTYAQISVKHSLTVKKKKSKQHCNLIWIMQLKQLPCYAISLYYLLLNKILKPLKIKLGCNCCAEQILYSKDETAILRKACLQGWPMAGIRDIGFERIPTIP